MERSEELVKSDDVAITLARNVANVQYENLPTEVVEITKKHILDELGAIVGGSAALGCRELVEQIKEWGGKEESTILVWGGRVPAHHAAQVNSTMSHALEYDDTHPISADHAGAAVIPAGFAIAERKGKIRGKELITAIALGIDLSYRLALAPKYRTKYCHDGWWPSQLHGYFGAAATVGKILGFDEKKTLSNGRQNSGTVVTKNRKREETGK